MQSTIILFAPQKQTWRCSETMGFTLTLDGRPGNHPHPELLARHVPSQPPITAINPFNKVGG